LSASAAGVVLFLQSEIDMQVQPKTSTRSTAAPIATPWYNKLGPGLITGAADDDPSGIATYSQSGAQFGYQILWTVLFTYPLMVGIQIVSARIGRVTGEGLSSNIRRNYSPALLYAIIGMLLIANTVNIAADVAAMGDALHLVIGGPRAIYIVFFGVLSLLMQVFIPYRAYVRVLKWLTLALLSYVGVVFCVHIEWLAVLTGLLTPKLSLNVDYVTTVVAIFGTTISPYLFFWQASQEVEDMQTDADGQGLRESPEHARAHLSRIKVDTWIGMGISNLIAFFIMLTTAATLFANGITNIQTSAQAALALKPIAGDFAFMLFSAGVIGTGLLAIPVLAGSAAYAVAGAFGWSKGLDLKLNMGKRFYGIIAASTMIGALLGLTELDPIRALFWAAVINGVISVPIMAVMMRMAVNKDIMGPFTITRRLTWLGWASTGVMAAAVLAMFVTML
jgi:NRAMP (natural resistance-associated macrophage protein)-like metal ion transporter